jgi:hypothetical protein
MAITFPASPVNGQTHTENGQIFVFDSTRGYWLLKKQDQIVASTSRSTFVATAGQTVHNVSYDPSASVIVSVNGVMLNPQDVTATNGTSITFDTALTLLDEVDIVFHQPTASNLIRQDISDPMATESYVQTYVTNNSSVGVTTVADMAALIALTGMANGDQALVTANNNLFIYSGSGWYKIATVQNNAPSAITGVSGTYELAIDGTSTVITAVSTDPEGFPLTWSYSASGLGNIATISQVDNVFTITPSTTIADAGTFSLTINATDGINGAVSTSTNLTLEFIIIVTNSRYTTLLATATDTSDNNNITDMSSNNHSITVNGDAHAGTFSPYRSGGYATYFDGAGDYIDTGLNNVATDFTFECWVNTTVGGMLMARYASGSALDGFVISLTSGVPVIQINTNTNNLNGTVDLRDGKWHHLAFVRDSNVCKIFVDGVLDVSQTDSEPMQVNANWIIGRHGNSASYYYGGYIRDLRWIAGTARYTGNFTPPTEPLTTLSGDNLFTCHLPYIIDGSATPYTMTSYGNVTTKPFSPYDYEEYDTADHGGSLYFNGTNSAVQIADNDDFDFGTGDLTIECWVYPEVIGNNYPGFLGTTAGWGSVAASGMRFDNLGDSKFQMSWYGPGDPFLETQSTYAHNQWYHFVVTRTGGNTWRMFINGILEDTGTNSTPYDICVGGHSLQIGGKTWDGTNGWFKGNVADLRLTKGSVVTEYQTSSTTTGTQIFTPRTTPITSSGSELHIKGTDASIIDKSQGSNLKLTGSVGSTTQVKFSNTKSMYFDGIDDHIEGPTVSDLNIGTGDFTIECWIYETTTNTNKGIWDGREVGTSTDGFTFTRIGVDTFRVWSGSALITTGSFTIQNTWNHCALVRNSGTLTIYINGASSGTPVSNSTNFSNSGKLIIGAGRHSTGSNATAFITGYIQDLRVSNYSRYTTNFTPPTAPLKG